MPPERDPIFGCVMRVYACGDGVGDATRTYVRVRVETLRSVCGRGNLSSRLTNARGGRLGIIFANFRAYVSRYPSEFTIHVSPTSDLRSRHSHTSLLFGLRTRQQTADGKTAVLCINQSFS